MASVSKRSWAAPDGSTKTAWTVRYKDATGSYRSRQFERKKDADRYRTKVELEIGDGDHIARSQSRNLADGAKLFLEEIKNKVAIGAMRPTTAYNYECAFRTAVLPGLGHRVLLEIEPRHIEEWYHALVRTGRMSPLTARRRIVYLAGLFDFAARRRWMRKGKNPAIEALEAIGRPKKTPIETFALEDVRKVVELAEERRYNGRQRPHAVLRLAVNLAAFLGLRWGEIFGLTLNAIDLEKRVLHVRHSLDGFGNLQDPKTKAGNRSVPLPNHIFELLADFLARWPVTHPEGIVFVTETGMPHRAGNFRKHSWLPLLARAGVKGKRKEAMHFHALRHFACSWMIENGWPITDVSSILGHANVSVTLNVYAHSIKDRSRSADAMQNLAEKLLAERVQTAPLALPDNALLTHEIEEGVFSMA